MSTAGGEGGEIKGMIQMVCIQRASVNNEKQFSGTAELKINKACGHLGWKLQGFEMLKSQLTAVQNVTLFRNRIIVDVIS